jgi:hypothetical protein
MSIASHTSFILFFSCDCPHLQRSAEWLQLRSVSVFDISSLLVVCFCFTRPFHTHQIMFAPCLTAKCLPSRDTEISSHQLILPSSHVQSHDPWPAWRLHSATPVTPVFALGYVTCLSGPEKLLRAGARTTSFFAICRNHTMAPLTVLLLDLVISEARFITAKLRQYGHWIFCLGGKFCW